MRQVIGAVGADALPDTKSERMKLTVGETYFQEPLCEIVDWTLAADGVSIRTTAVIQARMKPCLPIGTRPASAYGVHNLGNNLMPITPLSLNGRIAGLTRFYLLSTRRLSLYDMLLSVGGLYCQHVVHHYHQRFQLIRPNRLDSDFLLESLRRIPSLKSPTCQLIRLCVVIK